VTTKSRFKKQYWGMVFCKQPSPFFGVAIKIVGWVLKTHSKATMPSRELALLIDGPNLHVTAKTLGFDIDYKRLLAEFQSRGCSARCIIAPIKIFQGSVRYSIGRETTGPPQRTTPPSGK